jgi:S1-C subfamily serine protease
MTAIAIKRRLKDAPSLASLPPAAPGAVPANASAVSAVATPGPSAVRLGIQARILTDEEAQKLNASVKGLYVMRVDKDSVADLMQMQAGDVIVEVNGKKVDGVEQLRQMLGNGSDVVVKVWRNGVVQALAVPQSL